MPNSASLNGSESGGEHFPAKFFAFIANVSRIIAALHIILSLPCGEQKRQNLRIMNTTTLPSTNSMNGSSCPLALLLIPLALVFFALAPAAQAVDPPPDGGYFFQNTAEGEDALFSLTAGIDDTAIGFEVLYSNTTGSFNTANGISALYSNTTGFENTAIGVSALASNSTGNYNTATGAGALGQNTASNNTATGTTALYLNTTGSNNTAHGYQALFHNTTSSENTANGANALFTNKTGSHNTADGSGALFSNRFGNFNTAVGRNALYNNKTGASNIALGNNAGFNSTGSQNIDIDNDGVGGESATIRIGGSQTNTYIAGISGATVPGGIGVIIDSSGHLGTTTSSARFKDEIHPMDKASEAILALQPVTFRYKKELDPKGIPQFGLVAEEVEKINPELVARDKDGKPYSVRYEAVNAMLLNEFLKEHREVQELKKQIAALTAGLQKVTAQLELSKIAPQTVLNNR